MTKEQAQLDQELKELKTKYASVYELKIPIDDNGEKFATVFLRPLDRIVYKVVQNLIQKDSLQAVTSLINSLYIGGDDPKLITEDFQCLRSAEEALVSMLQARQGQLKKN